MPSEKNAMGSVSKQEEDTEKSNEQSVTLRTLSSTIQEASTASTNHTSAPLANVNKDKISVSDIRTKYLNSTGDAVSSATAGSLAESDSLEVETLCHKDMTSNVDVNRRLFPSFFYTYCVKNYI